jgi:hypothetical protein
MQVTTTIYDLTLVLAQLMPMVLLGLLVVPFKR